MNASAAAQTRAGTAAWLRLLRISNAPTAATGALVGGVVGEATQHHMAKLPRLLADGGDEARMAVAVNHAPPGAGGVQQPLATGQGEVGALASDHRRRQRLGLHLGIGVPEGGR